MGHSDSADDSSELETEITERANFTERLGTTDWCECAKCMSMPVGSSAIVVVEWTNLKNV